MWVIEPIREEHGPFCARIVIAGDWEGDVKTASKLLKEICEKWLKGKRVNCLITCGGFLNFEWPSSLSAIGDNKNPKEEAVEFLKKKAKNYCDSLLQDDLYKKLKKCADCLTIGIDSHKSKISTTRNYIPEHHVELICLVDLKTKGYHWTGKSYPTIGQERSLIRIGDLETHFFDLDFGKVMILGCHDLTIFNPRSKNAKGWRAKINKDFRDLAIRKKPTCVFQHPHTTDSIRTWVAAWNGLTRTIPSVEKYASAGRYYNPNGYPRSELDDVLAKTKCGNTIDIVVKISEEIK